MKVYHVLIVENEPLLCYVYKNVFNQISKEGAKFQFSYHIYKEFKTVHDQIKKRDTNVSYDLTIFDIRMTSEKKGVALYAEELCIDLKKSFPSIKIAIITSLEDNYHFYTIFKKLNPEGFMMKNEIDYPTLKNYLRSILLGQNVYTQTIINFLTKEVGMNLRLDDLNRKMLYLLSKGIKTKELPLYLPLSISGIEKRKRNLAKTFNLGQSDTHFLVEKAKKLHLIS